MTAPLREDLLAGLHVVGAGPLRPAVLDSLTDLGARVHAFDDELGEAAAQAWAAGHGALHGVVYDAAAPFAAGGVDGLMAAIERGWPVVRAVVAGALIPAGAGGRIVLIAPAADAPTHAQAARAALENMARTLSIEWARHDITTTAIAPGPATTDANLATLAGFLLSAAGGYFSGCRFELDGLPEAAAG